MLEVVDAMVVMSMSPYIRITSAPSGKYEVVRGSLSGLTTFYSGDRVITEVLETGNIQRRTRVLVSVAVSSLIQLNPTHGNCGIVGIGPPYIEMIVPGMREELASVVWSLQQVETCLTDNAKV